MPGSAPSPAQRLARDGDLRTGTSLVVPARGLDELDLDLGRDVGAARAAVPAAGAEQVVAEERGEEVAEVAEVEAARREPAAAEAGVAVAVVELARLGLGEHLVRLGDLAEAHLCVGRVGDVGVELAREPPERAS